MVGSSTNMERDLKPRTGSLMMCFRRLLIWRNVRCIVTMIVTLFQSESMRFARPKMALSEKKGLQISDLDAGQSGLFRYGIVSRPEE